MTITESVARSNQRVAYVIEQLIKSDDVLSAVEDLHKLCRDTYAAYNDGTITLEQRDIMLKNSEEAIQIARDTSADPTGSWRVIHADENYLSVKDKARSLKAQGKRVRVNVAVYDRSKNTAASATEHNELEIIGWEKYESEYKRERRSNDGWD